MPMTYGLDVVCNTSDEEILHNVLVNAKRTKNWAKSLPAHDRTLVICGSGPSFMDELPRFRELYEAGADVWALNNCVKFLKMQGIMPDCQVIMDAREATADMIGPAREHLFASQCHPSCFDVVPNATLWHATLGNTMVDQQPGFPAHDDEYCLIGSAVTVGNTALVLAFALGYRTIHLFGYDSSHREAKGHLIHQSLNDDDPLTLTRFRDKEYVSSLTMKLQADAFPSRASVLVREGVKLFVHGSGLLPDRWNATFSELEKYTEMWNQGDYGDISPGELQVERFLSLVQLPPNSYIIDFGCGSGKAAVKLSKLLACQLTLVDLCDNSRISEAQHFHFLQADLTSSWPLKIGADYGFCCDVMEHLPTDLVDKAIRNIMHSVPVCFFQISLIPDDFGGAIGRPLHLTVAPVSWWLNTFTSLGYDVTFHENDKIAAIFLIQRKG